MTIAIKGHATRGKEVIELLKMLGGSTSHNLMGSEVKCVYYIRDDNKIGWIHYSHLDDDIIFFTLEEFLEKYPYKVGDKVIYDNSVHEIIEMKWSENLNTISYGVSNGKIKNLAIVDELQPYKEETMEEKKINQMSLANCDLDEVEIVLGDKFEMKIKDGKYYAIRKKPQYPKTYDECCNMYGVDCVTFSLETFKALRELIYCRNSYWKIAGEQMELGKPWEPDWCNDDQRRYTIITFENMLYKDISCVGTNRILVFPTEEMRDTFYDNFKDLIEQCKELL